MPHLTVADRRCSQLVPTGRLVSYVKCPSCAHRRRHIAARHPAITNRRLLVSQSHCLIIYVGLSHHISLPLYPALHSCRDAATPPANYRWRADRRRPEQPLCRFTYACVESPALDAAWLLTAWSAAANQSTTTSRSLEHLFVSRRTSESFRAKPLLEKLAFQYLKVVLKPGWGCNLGGSVLRGGVRSAIRRFVGPRVCDYSEFKSGKSLWQRPTTGNGAAKTDEIFILSKCDQN